ncbi:hypothetical protein ACTL6U_15465 [Rhodovibrionaceae bacterium A322]
MGQLLTGIGNGIILLSAGAVMAYLSLDAPSYTIMLSFGIMAIGFLLRAAGLMTQRRSSDQRSLDL